MKDETGFLELFGTMLSGHYTYHNMVGDLVHRLSLDSLTSGELRMIPALGSYLVDHERAQLARAIARYLRKPPVGEENLRCEAVDAFRKLVFGDDARHTRRFETKDTREKEGHYYSYIPYDELNFVDVVLLPALTLFTADGKNDHKPRFIDVGSGIGDKVLLAHLLGFKASGVEYNQDTYSLSKYFLRDWDHIDLYRGDALEFGFTDYDVIYMYCPIADSTLMTKLHFRVMDQMPVGSVMIETLFTGSCEYDMCERLSIGRKGLRYIYRTGVDSYSAGNHREFLEWTGQKR